MKAFTLIAVTLLLSACLGMPPGIEPVEDFELERYLGTWHEIARLDHSFERGLDKVTARYSLREDGSVQVLNRGYVEEKQRWEDAEGTASFVEEENVGYFKVSFFGPFYGSYVIFELGYNGSVEEGAEKGTDTYDYAFVSGPNTSLLWLLSRQSQVGPSVLKRFQVRAQALGFDTNQLIYPDHD